MTDTHEWVTKACDGDQKGIHRSLLTLEDCIIAYETEKQKAAQ